MKIELDQLLIDNSEKRIARPTPSDARHPTLWPTQLAIHQKAQEASKFKLEACIAERAAIYELLQVPTLNYPTLRALLEAEDSKDKEWAAKRGRELDYERYNPVSGRSVSPGPETHFPSLETIFTGVDRANPPFSFHGLPQEEREFRRCLAAASNPGNDWPSDYGDFSTFYPIPPPPHGPSTSQLTNQPIPVRHAGRSTRQSTSQPKIVPQQPSLACSLEAIATDFIPEEIRKKMNNFTPILNRLHNPLDAPYQRIQHATTVIQSAVQDLRNFPQPPPPSSKQAMQDRTTPRFMRDDFMAPGHPAPLPYIPHQQPTLPYETDPLAYLPNSIDEITNQSGPPKTYRHHSISCDACQEGVKGVRFKCNVRCHLSLFSVLTI
jgi:hypothetical protein